MARLNIDNFYGWLSLVDPSNIEDNQFETLTNMFYNKDKRIQTRRGITTFGNAIAGDPITSYFFFQNDSTGDRTAVCTAWTNMYEYNEWTSNWDSIKAWLTQYETDGVTLTRWSFAVYKNIIYMCNGVDDYASYNPATTTYTEYGTQPLVRYLRYMWDRIFGAWDDDNPSTLYYMDAAAADAATINTNVVIVGWDELGRINGILDLGQIVLVFKNKKVYSVNVAWETAQPIDSQNGWYSHRALANVENAIFYYNDSGVDSLKSRNWVTGASWLATEPLTQDLRQLTEQITSNSYNYNIGKYIPALNNYYFTFDTTDDKQPDTTLVWSALTSGWSKYTLPAANDYGYYIDEDGVYHYLIASANGGQMYEIETGFQDNDLEIPTEIKTKRWDFGDSAIWKTYDTVDIIGLKNLWSDVTVEIIVDWEVEASSIINDTFVTSTTTTTPISTRPISVWTIGWWVGTGEEVDLFPYLIRIPISSSGANIQVRMYSNDNPNIRTLDKIRINYLQESLDIFPINNIW